MNALMRLAGVAIFTSALGTSWALAQDVPCLEATSGPQGGAVSAIAQDTNGVIYACTSAGVFRSRPGGWDLVSREIGFPGIHAIEITPAESILAGTRDGLFRSADGGDTWAGAGRIVGGTTTRRIACAPDGTVYLTTGGQGGAPGVTMYRSTDDGLTFSELEGAPEEGLALGVNSDGDLFLGGIGELHRSRDGGATWMTFTDGLPDSTMKEIAFHPSGDVYGATDGGGAVYRSTDDGESWGTAGDTSGFDSAGSGNAAYELVIAPNGDVYAGLHSLFVLRNGETTWTRSSLPHLLRFDLELGPQGAILAGTPSGLVLSIDDGRSWTDRFQGFVGATVRGLARSSSGVVYAQADSGTWRSTDHGVNWSLILAGTPVGIGVDPSGRVYVGQQSVIFRSRPGGTDFSPLHPISGPRPGEGVEYAFNGSGHIFSLNGSGLRRSTNDGDSWVLIVQPTVNTLAIDASGTLFISTSDRTLLRSVDGGDTFVPSDSGLPESTCVRVTPEGHGGGIYAVENRPGLDMRVFRSDDGGATWTPAGGELEERSTDRIVVHPNGHLYLGDFCSADGGQTWLQIGSGLADDLTRNGYPILLAADGSILRATSGFGVLRAPADLCTTCLTPVDPPDPPRPDPEPIVTTTATGASTLKLKKLGKSEAELATTLVLLDNRTFTLDGLTEQALAGTWLLRRQRKRKSKYLLTLDAASWTAFLQSLSAEASLIEPGTDVSVELKKPNAPPLKLTIKDGVSATISLSVKLRANAPDGTRVSKSGRFKARLAGPVDDK